MDEGGVLECLDRVSKTDSIEKLNEELAKASTERVRDRWFLASSLFLFLAPHPCLLSSLLS